MLIRRKVYDWIDIPLGKGCDVYDVPWHNSRSCSTLLRLLGLSIDVVLQRADEFNPKMQEIVKLTLTTWYECTNTIIKKEHLHIYNKNSLQATFRPLLNMPLPVFQVMCSSSKSWKKLVTTSSMKIYYMFNMVQFSNKIIYLWRFKISIGFSNDPFDFSSLS